MRGLGSSYKLFFLKGPMCVLAHLYQYFFFLFFFLFGNGRAPFGLLHRALRKKCDQIECFVIALLPQKKTVEIAQNCGNTTEATTLLQQIYQNNQIDTTY